MNKLNQVIKLEELFRLLSILVGIKLIYFFFSNPQLLARRDQGAQCRRPVRAPLFELAVDVDGIPEEAFHRVPSMSKAIFIYFNPF